MSDRVLFLDVDGVLNSHEYFGSPRMKKPGRVWENHIDDRAVRRLAGLVRSVGCDVVISSTWRDGAELLGGICGALFDHDVAVRGRTRRDLATTTGIGRGQEIAEWLSRHAEYRRFVILDDDSDMLPSQMPWLLLINPAHGLRVEDCVNAERLFAARAS